MIWHENIDRVSSASKSLSYCKFWDVNRIFLYSLENWTMYEHKPDLESVTSKLCTHVPALNLIYRNVWKKIHCIYDMIQYIWERERDGVRERELITDTQESITKSPEFAYKDHANDLG